MTDEGVLLIISRDERNAAACRQLPFSTSTWKKSALVLAGPITATADMGDGPGLRLCSLKAARSRPRLKNSVFVSEKLQSSRLRREI